MKLNTFARGAFLVSSLFAASLVLTEAGVLSAAEAPVSMVDGPVVTLLKTPDGGLQPQALVDSRGTLHLIYFKGKPMMGDIFYRRSTDGGSTFSAPLQVNSQTGSAIAMGTIRGAQIALGKDNRVHVAWNGSKMAEPRGAGGTPMLYTRMGDDGSAFEPQRNLITWAGGIDGGGTIAAAPDGNVYVAWHAAGETKADADRTVFLAHSTDDGHTFGREKKINTLPTGVCACCQMRAFVDSKGTLSVLYRAAGDDVERDSTLLVSIDRGATFASAMVHPWNIMACPMSSYAFTEDKEGLVRAAWETEGQIFVSSITSTPLNFSPPLAAPGRGTSRRHPTLASGKDDTILLAWTEGTGWNRGGSLAWQILDANGEPTAQKGRAAGVPVWSSLAAVARPDGSFLLFH